jgi:hypothetical protein
MINYISINQNLNELTGKIILLILFWLLISTIVIFYLYSDNFWNNKKKSYNVLSWIIFSVLTLFSIISCFWVTSTYEKEIKRLESKYSFKEKTLEKNIEVIKNEIEYFKIKDKNLYVNQILNKFYKNEKNFNTNSFEKEIMKKLVK